MAQIGCYMTGAEARRLEDYAASMGLRLSSLCALVIQYELRKPTLRRIRPPKSEAPAGDRVRVTAHLRNAALKAAFTGHVRSYGLGSDEAAAILFRAELKERRFFNMFGLPENHG